MTVEDEIKEIEEEISKTQYNKATQKHIGILKAKLAKLRAGGSKSSGKKGAGYSVKKAGDATVLLVGFPSVGKSTLLNSITNAESKVGDYDFTTLDVIPGVLEYNGAKIQVLDVPGIIEGVSGGRGRGKEILSVIRTADLVLIMTSADKMGEQLPVLEKELYSAGFRLNQEPPDIKITRKDMGGIRISSTVKQDLSTDTIKSMLNMFGIINADVLVRVKLTEDSLVDSVVRNRVYVPSLLVVNKIDKADLHDRPGMDFIKISALKGTNVEEVKKKIWEKLGLVRIFLKRIGKEADMKVPLIMKRKPTVEDVCIKIHKDFSKDFKYARVWGSSRFEGQKVGIDFVLSDGDVVELHL